MPRAAERRPALCCDGCQLLCLLRRLTLHGAVADCEGAHPGIVQRLGSRAHARHDLGLHLARAVVATVTQQNDCAHRVRVGQAAWRRGHALYDADHWAQPERQLLEHLLHNLDLHARSWHYLGRSGDLT